MTKNFVKTQFKSLWRGILMGLCITGLLLFSNDVFGAVIFVDDFNSYNDGNLGGQGGWVDVGFDDDFQVQGTTTFEGLKAITCLGNEECADEKIGAETPTGSMSFSVRLANNELYGIEGLGVWLEDDGISMFKVELGVKENDIEIWIYGGDPLGVDKWIEFDWIDEWLTIDTEWDFSNQKWRVGYKGNWSGWTNSYLNRNWIGIDTIEISSNAGVSPRYFDTISEGPVCDSENCGLCEGSENCIAAGCQWFYSILFQKWFCSSIVEPTPDECGVFWDCQYCLDQFSCEEDKIGFCEWVDRGTGEKCWMTEPIYPPDQDWEVPVLEDCGELLGVEMWLCEIKNDLLGVVMPSQEKISDLYKTIGAFKDRFPFNYIESLKTFFSEISVSFDEEKTIPIKILGQEGNVSFEFWDQETEIGGIGESFKNVLFDFSTFIILMGFFVWLISSIRRFF